MTIAGDGDAATDSALAHLPQLPARDEADVAMLAILIFAAIESGHRLSELEDYLTRMAGDAIRLRARDIAGVAALGIGRHHLLRGRYRDAARWLTEADVQLQRGDPFNQLVIVRAATVLAVARTRDYAAVLAAHERLTAWVAEHEPLAAQRPGIVRADAAVEWLRDPAAAGRRLITAAETFAEEMPGLAPGLAYDALRAGHPGAAAVIKRLAARCRARIVTAFADHAAAHDARDGAALLRVAEAMAEIGAARYAVEAASEAATVFVAEGRSDSARRAAARARELHLEGQGATLPAIDGLDTTAVELTPRESQLIEFARQGLSNAEIADRLVISVRTVETHLYRGMQKLGVRDRRDL
jgi:DNA-binding NarL/FixJ family response regulator